MCQWHWHIGTLLVYLTGFNGGQVGLVGLSKVFLVGFAGSWGDGGRGGCGDGGRDGSGLCGGDCEDGDGYYKVDSY